MKTFLASVLASLVAISTAQSSVHKELERMHNADRPKHCAPPLRYNAALEAAAIACARWNANRGSMDHNCPYKRGLNSGENLAGGSSLTAASAYKMWYDENKYYNYRNGAFSSLTGHFTQVVWKGTTEIGCGIATGKTTIISCLYSPPGNYIGQFQNNVFDPRIGCRNSG